MTRALNADPAARRWVILALIVLAQTVANIGPLGIPAIASLIQADLSLTLTQAGSFLPAYRDPPGDALTRRAPGERGPVRAVLLTRDLWLVALATLVFAAMQTVWMAFLALYLQDVVGLGLLAASRYLALAQAGGVLGRIAVGVLSDRTFGGRRRTPLTIAGCGSTLCSIAIAFTEPASPTLAVVFGFFGIGWNGVQHTLMAELAGPRAATTAVGLGLAVSRRHARPTGLRRVRRVGGRLPRAVARLGAHDGGRAPGPGARPRAPAPRVAFLTRARSFLTPAPSPRPAGATPPS